MPSQNFPELKNGDKLKIKKQSRKENLNTFTLYRSRLLPALESDEKEIENVYERMTLQNINVE